MGFEQTDGRSGFSFPLRSVRGQLESVTQILGVSPKLSSSGLAFSMTNPIDSFIYQTFLLAQGSVLVPSTKFNIQIGAGRHVSHPCYHEGAWPNSLARRPPWLYASSVKNKKLKQEPHFPK